MNAQLPNSPVRYVRNAMEDIGMITALDEMLNHQIVDTFSTTVTADHSWTEKIWSAIVRKDGTLGGYVSLVVLCHAGVEPERALSEAYRCLQPGAVAVLNLPAYAWMFSAHDKRTQNGRRFTRGEARALMARHGFHILRASYWNMFLFPLMLLHRLIERDDAKSDVREYPRWQDAIFSTALAVERAIIATGISLPFGGSLLVVAIRED